MPAAHCIVAVAILEGTPGRVASEDKLNLSLREHSEATLLATEFAVKLLARRPDTVCRLTARGAA